MDPIIKAIQSGSYGTGQFIAVINANNIRFTKAIALGSCIYPEGYTLLEEELNVLQTNVLNDWGGNDYFIVEVPNDEVPPHYVINRLLQGVVKRGYYAFAIKKAFEVDDEDQWISSGFISFHLDREVVHHSCEIGGALCEVDGVCCQDGNLFFITTLNKVEVSCDGKVYPYDTTVLPDGSFSQEPVRDMTKGEWHEVEWRQSVARMKAEE